MAAVETVRLALVQCPVWGVDDPPLGLAQLAGCVTHCNQEARVLDLNVRFRREAPEELRELWSWDSLGFWDDRERVAELVRRTEPLWARYAEEVLAGSPHAVGFSAARGSQWASLELAARIKRLDPSVAVIFGGPHLLPAGRAEELLREPAADIAIVGGAEDLFPKMIGLYRATGRWTPLPGMLLKDKDGIVRGGRPVPYTFDLDISPSPDFAGFAWAQYARPERLPLSGSRGCPSACAYCGSREFWPRWSFKSGDRIFGDVLRLRSANPSGRDVRFYDIVANGNPASLTRFAGLMREHGLVEAGLRWTINATPSPAMDGPTLASMAAGGCAEIVYGVESAAPALLAAMGRPAEFADPAPALRATRDAGIRCVVSIVAGLPGETEDDAERTREWLRRHRGSIDAVCVAPVAVEEPSLLQRRPERFGPVPADAAERARRFAAHAADLGLAVDERRFAAATAPIAAAA